MRFRARRVVVKARVVKLRGAGSKAALAHLRDLQRDGATLDGERGRLYSAFQDEADGAKFLDRGEGRSPPVPPHRGAGGQPPSWRDLRNVTRRPHPRRWSATWKRSSIGSRSITTTPAIRTATSSSAA